MLRTNDSESQQSDLKENRKLVVTHAASLRHGCKIWTDPAASLTKPRTEAARFIADSKTRASRHRGSPGPPISESAPPFAAPLPPPPHRTTAASRPPGGLAARCRCGPLSARWRWPRRFLKEVMVGHGRRSRPPNGRDGRGAGVRLCAGALARLLRPFPRRAGAFVGPCRRRLTEQ